MDIILTKTTCWNCGIKLTEYEVMEKNSYCMDCYKEKEEQEKKERHA
ncbi:hypothetical protein P9597_20520 [Aneurinibacillus migulanus]|nr:hypothetical protein [Aneurinibacillus migulanus]